MGEPLSETAHYLARVDRGGTDLFLIQDGRLEASGVVPIVWERRAEGAPGTGAPPEGPLGAARRRAVQILSAVWY